MLHDSNRVFLRRWGLFCWLLLKVQRVERLPHHFHRCLFLFHASGSPEAIGKMFLVKGVKSICSRGQLLISGILFVSLQTRGRSRHHVRHVARCMNFCLCSFSLGDFKTVMTMQLEKPTADRSA